MPIIETKMPQKVSHWKAGGRDQFGAPTWSGPNILDGIWQERQELTVNENGQEILSNAIVFLTSDVSTGDYLMLGEAASGENDPTAISGTWEVKNYQKTRSMLENSTFDRKAVL